MSNFTANFSNGAVDLTCKLCNEENTQDSENHSFNCKVINALIPDTINKSSRDVYAKNINILKEGMKLMTQILELRKELLG